MLHIVYLSLWQWVFSSGTSVWTLLSLVIWIDVDNSSLVLESLLSSSDDELLESFLLLDLWGLISNFTVTSQGTVLLSYDKTKVKHVTSEAWLTYPWFMFY